MSRHSWAKSGQEMVEAKRRTDVGTEAEGELRAWAAWVERVYVTVVRQSTRVPKTCFDGVSSWIGGKDVFRRPRGGIRCWLGPPVGAPCRTHVEQKGLGGIDGTHDAWLGKSQVGRLSRMTPLIFISPGAGGGWLSSIQRRVDDGGSWMAAISMDRV